MHRVFAGSCCANTRELHRQSRMGRAISYVSCWLTHAEVFSDHLSSPFSDPRSDEIHHPEFVLTYILFEARSKTVLTVFLMSVLQSLRLVICTSVMRSAHLIQPAHELGICQGKRKMKRRTRRRQRKMVRRKTAGMC